MSPAANASAVPLSGPRYRARAVRTHLVAWGCPARKRPRNHAAVESAQGSIPHLWIADRMALPSSSRPSGRSPGGLGEHHRARLPLLVPGRPHRVPFAPGLLAQLLWHRSELLLQQVEVAAQVDVLKVPVKYVVDERGQITVPHDSSGLGHDRGVERD